MRVRQVYKVCLCVTERAPVKACCPLGFLCSDGYCCPSSLGNCCSVIKRTQPAKKKKPHTHPSIHNLLKHTVSQVLGLLLGHTNTHFCDPSDLITCLDTEKIHAHTMTCKVQPLLCCGIHVCSAQWQQGPASRRFAFFHK